MSDNHCNFPTACNTDIPEPLENTSSSVSEADEPAVVIFQPAEQINRKSSMENFEVEAYKEDLMAYFGIQKRTRIHVKEALGYSEPVNVSRYFYAMLELANIGSIVIDRPKHSEQTDDWFIAVQPTL